MGSVFVLCVIVYLILTLYKHIKNKKFKEYLSEVYSDENLKKMDYDNSPYDEILPDGQNDIVEEVEVKTPQKPDKPKEKEVPKKENKIIDED